MASLSIGSPAFRVPRLRSPAVLRRWILSNLSESFYVLEATLRNGGVERTMLCDPVAGSGAKRPDEIMNPGGAESRSKTFDSCPSWGRVPPEKLAEFRDPGPGR
jgi:hypothetical protein